MIYIYIYIYMYIYIYIYIYMQVGSFEGVSFFAQDVSMSPCDVTEWYELGSDGATANPTVFVQALSSNVALQILELAAGQATSTSSVMLALAGRVRGLEFAPASVELKTLPEDMRLLLELLFVDGDTRIYLNSSRTYADVASFDDATWLRANEAYRRVMLDLFMALGEGQTNFVVDQRLPYQHAHALLLLTDLLEGAQRSTEVPKSLYTVLKFISKKEGLLPVVRRLKEDNCVPLFLQQRQMTKMCQVIIMPVYVPNVLLMCC